MSDPYLKNIVALEPRTMRNRELARVRDGQPESLCPHPMSAVYIFEDTESEHSRNGRPTNLFQCDICKSLLWLVDAHGRIASEG